MAGLGYSVDYRELRACDYGAPTIRKRFFMVMRCDGVAVRWPDATHGDPKLSAVQSGALRPWRTAAECVARCGNAVPPPFAEALVRANLPELCTVQQQEVA